MSATASFINEMLDTAFVGVITMRLFTGNIPSAGGVEVTGGDYEEQTLAMDTAASKRIEATDDATFTNLPTSTIVAYGVYRDDVRVDEGTLTSPFTADVTNNTLTISYAFEIDA